MPSNKDKYNVCVKKVNIIFMIKFQIVKYLHKLALLKQKWGFSDLFSFFFFIFFYL